MITNVTHLLPLEKELPILKQNRFHFELGNFHKNKLETQINNAQ